MKNDLKTKLLLPMFLAALFFFCSSGVAGAGAIDRTLYSELLKFPTDKKIVEVHGVPCLKIFLPKGHSISHFCRSVKYLNRDYYFFRQQIALMNRLEPMAVVDATDDLSTEVEFIYVPLNFSIRPQILPEHIGNISHLPKYILIHIGKQCLGLYEYGELTHLFPISSGKNGTPTKKFVLLSKERDHYSTKYDNAWMPYSMRLFGNYFLHGGILPSYAASHGCIRLIYENAVFVYNWADIGTPGETTNRTIIQQRDLSASARPEEADIKVLYY
ncbi:MAG: L,D-transpeptidase [Syntrophobacteraceae bacterium]